jgi:hypothetical protein
LFNGFFEFRAQKKFQILIQKKSVASPLKLKKERRRNQESEKSLVKDIIT